MLIWNKKVYSKIKTRLTEAFTRILNRLREQKLENEKGKLRNQSKEIITETNLYNRDSELELLGGFTQYIADLSINEITVHYLGSTKMILDNPYSELHKTIITQTEYYV